MVNFSIGHSIGYDAINTNQRKNNAVSKMQKSVKYNSDNDVSDTENSRSGILFEQWFFAGRSNQVTQEPFRIRYSDSFTPENPILILETMDRNGDSIKTEININNIDPNNATGFEILALLSYHYKTNPDVGREKLYDAFFRLNSASSSGKTKQEYLENPSNWNTLLRERMDNLFPHGQMAAFANIKELLDIINRGRN